MSKCVACKNTMTWEHQRRQYGRLTRAGFSARDIMPRCQKCVTLYLGTRPRWEKPNFIMTCEGVLT
jgi:hypothetical protein